MARRPAENGVHPASSVTLGRPILLGVPAIFSHYCFVIIIFYACQGYEKILLKNKSSSFNSVFNHIVSFEDVNEGFCQ